MEQNFIENELIILSKQTLDLFLKEENASDIISVYTFYYYTAKWQKTNQPKATDSYVMRGLKMGSKKFKNAKKFLQDSGLINQVFTQDKNGKITGWYIKMNYIWGNDKVLEATSPVVPIATSGSGETNALNANSINALNANNIQEVSKVTLNPKQGKTPIARLQSLYSLYFRHTYGFKPKNYAELGKCLKDLLRLYSEIQIASLLIVFFNWQGMDNHQQGEKDWLIKSTHSIWLFKRGINQYEAYIRNVQGLTEEFEDDEKLYKYVQESIGKVIHIS